MHNRAAQDLRAGPSTIVLYPKYQTILEREYMEFRPFGVNEQGQKIRDLTGMSLRATVIYLEASVARQHGQAAACRRSKSCASSSTSGSRTPCTTSRRPS